MRYQKIGILCAGDTEVLPFLKDLKEDTIVKKAMLEFHTGTLCRTPVVVLFSGVCKVNAAIAAQILIDHFHTDLIINAGTAGGMCPNVRLFDTVIAEKIAYHDVADDILTEFHPWLSSIYFPSDHALLHIAKQFGNEYNKNSVHRIHFGTVVTGEQFIDNSAREKIIEAYHPLSVDMESAAAAHVCYVNRIPFLSIRTITDTPLQEGIDVFEKNCEQASLLSEKIVLALLERL